MLLTLKGLERRATTIVNARLGPNTPPIGHNQAEWFLMCNLNKVLKYWGSQIDNKWGRDINPNNREYWDVMENIIVKGGGGGHQSTLDVWHGWDWDYDGVCTTVKGDWAKREEHTTWLSWCQSRDGHCCEYHLHQQDLLEAYCGVQGQELPHTLGGSGQSRWSFVSAHFIGLNLVTYLLLCL